jgi:hypothetical protein
MNVQSEQMWPAQEESDYRTKKYLERTMFASEVFDVLAKDKK